MKIIFLINSILKFLLLNPALYKNIVSKDVTILTTHQ